MAQMSDRAVMSGSSVCGVCEPNAQKLSNRSSATDLFNPGVLSQILSHNVSW